MERVRERTSKSERGIVRERRRESKTRQYRTRQERIGQDRIYHLA